MDLLELILAKIGYTDTKAVRLRNVPTAFLSHYVETKKYKLTKKDVDILDPQQLGIIETDYRIFCSMYRIEKNIFDSCKILIEQGREDMAQELSDLYPSLIMQGATFADVKDEIIKISFKQLDKLLYL